MSNEIHIEGLDDIVKQITDIEQMKGLADVLSAAAIVLKGKIEIYPAQKSLTRASVYGTPFKSDKQRAYFFWALDKGIITVPYSRGADAKSERFGASWTVAAENNGLRQVIGNDTSYGPYLMDVDRQSQFMAAAGWPTVDKVAEDNAEETSQYVVYEMTQRLGLAT